MFFVGYIAKRKAGGKTNADFRLSRIAGKVFSEHNYTESTPPKCCQFKDAEALYFICFAQNVYNNPNLQNIT